MMFGFDPQWGFVNPIVGSSYAAESCESAANKFAWCDTYCKTNNDQSCVEYKQGKLGSLATTLDSVLSFLYLVMWPILYIAW